MTTLIKDICLTPAIGKWFEYRPAQKYTAAVIPGISAEMQQELLLLHYRFASQWGESIKAKLLLSNAVYAVSLAVMPYATFLGDRTGTTISAVVETGHAAGLLLNCDASLATGFMDRVAGGPGTGKQKAEALTDIETIMMTALFEEILGVYQQQWLNVLGLNTQTLMVHAPKLKSDDRLKKDEAVLVFTIRLAQGAEAPAILEIMLPVSLAERVTELYAEAQKKQPKRISVYLSPESVNNVKVPLSARIGGATLTMKEVLNLEVGDVVQLNEKLTDSLQIRIGEADFIGVLGRQQQYYAIKVLDRKNKYYDFQAVQATAVNTVVQPIVADIPAADLQDDFAQTEEALLPPSLTDVPAAELLPPEQPIEGPVQVDDIQIKDTLLDEFATDTKGSESSADEFTWDLDDLK